MGSEPRGAAKGGKGYPHRRYDWLQIRRDHAKGMTIQEISRKYKLRRQTVDRRAKMEGWAEQNRDFAADAMRQAITENANLVGREMATTLKEMLERTIPMAGKLAALADKTLDDALAGIAQPGAKSDPAEFLDKMASAVARTQEIARRGAGVQPTQPTIPMDGDEDAGKEYEVVIPPASA